MMLLISLLEFLLFLATDYSTSLIEPIIKLILNCLGCCKRVTYCPTCPWLVQGERVKLTLESVSYEMKRFQDMYFRTLNDTHELRYSLLRSLQHTILNTWPWIKGFHLSQVSSIEHQLNWTNYDLCLIDDWDIPNLAPLLSVELSHESELIATTISSSIHNERKLCRHPGAIRYSPGKGNFFLQVSTKRRERVESEEEEHKFTSGCPPLICARMMKTSDFKRQSLRSTLVFYYTQVHPDLNALYLVVGRSLELAGLLEPSASFAAAAAAAEIEREREKFVRSSHEEKEKSCHYLSRYALVLMLVAFLDSASFKTIKEKFESTPSYLARVLLAFLQAYSSQLNSSTAPLEGKKGHIYIRPSLRKAAELKMSLVIEEEGEGEENNAFEIREEVSSTRKGIQLVVLDPLPSEWKSPQRDHNKASLEGGKGACSNRQADKLIALNDINKESDLGRLTNLTKDFLSLRQVLCLFRCLEEKLSEYISKPDEFASKKSKQCQQDGVSSLLNSLFTLSSSRATHTNECTAHLTVTSKEEAEEDEEASQQLIINDSLRYSTFLKRVQGSNEKESSSGSQKVALSSCYSSLGSLLKGKGSGVRASNKLVGQRSCNAFGLSWRKVLTNLLYLFVFLLIREQLLSHLNGFMSSMNERTREDLIQLKYTIFKHDGGLLFAEAHKVYAATHEEADGELEGKGRGKVEEREERLPSNAREKMPGEEELEAKSVEVKVEGTGEAQEEPPRQPEASSSEDLKGTPKDVSAAESPSLISSEIKDEIWDEEKEKEEAAQRKRQEEEAQATSQVGADGQELLGELMKSLMMEAFAGGDFDLASLFNDDLDSENSSSTGPDEDDEDDIDNVNDAAAAADDDVKLTTPKSQEQEESEGVRYENEDKLDLSEMRDLFKNLKLAVRGAASIAHFLKPGKHDNVKTEPAKTVEKDSQISQTSPEVLEKNSINIDSTNQTDTVNPLSSDDKSKEAEKLKETGKEQKVEATQQRDEL